MTYQSEVLADAPVHYLRLDETSGTTAANLGSSALAATISGATLNEPAAGTIDGKSMKFPSGSTANVSAPTAGNLASNFTMELWHKRDTAITSNTNRALARFGSATTYLKLFLNPTTGQLWCQDNSAGGVGLMIVPSLTDGNWHHIVVAKSGTTFTFYVDGVSVGSGTLSIGTKNTTFVVSTSTAAENAGGWIDEAAYYPTAIAPTRIAAHYAEGTVSPGISVSSQAPAMSANLSTPSVTVTATTVINTAISAPAMTVNVTPPAPVVTAVDNSYQILSPTADAQGGNTLGGTATTGSLDSGKELYFNFPGANIPVGMEVTSATIELTRTSTTSASTSYEVRRITQAWVETDNNTWGWVGPVERSGNAPSGSSGTKVQIDVTSAYKNSDHGFALRHTAGSSSQFAMREHATESYRPRLIVTFAEIAQIPAVSIVDGPMGVSVAMPQHRFGVGTTVAAGAGSVSMDALAPTVAVVKSPIIKAKATTLTLQMPGGQSRNPDQFVAAGPMEAWIFAPNATQYIAVPSINTATPMEVSLAGTADNNISLKTDRRIFVTNQMKMNTTMVGIYSEEGDRYPSYLPGTLDSDDVWLKMDEAAGTVAVDATGEDSTRNDATYVGGPQFMVEGPQLRRAVRFDGIGDYIVADEYPQGATLDMDLTIEFSIKTTQLNGTVVRGGGLAPTFNGSNNIYGGTADSEIRLLNGELVLFGGSGSNLTYRTRKFIADGEWHHVVVSLPSATNRMVADYNISSLKPFFVTIDGTAEWVRFSTALYGRSFLPSSIMARLAGGVASQFVAGDMRDFIVRFNYAIGQNTAQKLYYEWSNALLVNPEPMAISISMPTPHSAKGNVKRMIALYGLPYGLNGYRDGWGTYYSVFAGYYIDNLGTDLPIGVGGSFINQPAADNIPPMQFRPAKPFMLEGYMVYPVAIAKTPGSNGGAFSAAGMENGEYIDPISRTYVDDKTGLPRFIDLDKDLAESITDFDAITAVNYPAHRPDDGPENLGQNADELREPRQHNLGLTNSEWGAARDALRDSILSAAYRGVNLWINEPHMAAHLGFIQGWDKHVTGAQTEYFGPGGIDATSYTNTKAEQIDAAHLTLNGQNSKWRAARNVGQFNFAWQANAKRKVVATEPGLTNLPGFEVTEKVTYASDNAWEPHAYFVAYDVSDRSNGLQIGDQLIMDMREAGSYTGNYPAFSNWSVGDPRQFIVSAKPQGIVGKAISKEMDFFYGPNGIVVPNRYKDNVYTIAAERGSVVRGRPIAGRAFIELMDPQTTQVKVPVDLRPGMWLGEDNKNVTSWSFDTRRYREIVAIFVLEKAVTRAGNTVVNLKTEDRYVETQDREWTYKPFISMNARGLNWLQATSALPAGDAKAYVPAMQLDVAGTETGITKTRNISIPVTGSMRLDAELRGAANYRGNDVREKALPMVITLDMRGTGKVIKVTPIELDLTTPDANGRGDGDKIYVYMDAVRNVTLFMKED